MWFVVTQEESATSVCLRDRAYHLGMSRIDSNPADRIEAANALVRGVPEEDEEEEEDGEHDEEGEEEDDEGDGYSE